MVSLNQSSASELTLNQQLLVKVDGHGLFFAPTEEVSGLIERGADVNARVDDVLARHLSVFAWDYFQSLYPPARENPSFFEKICAEDLDYRSLTASQIAVKVENISALRLLLEKRADPELRDREGRTAFYFVRSLETVQLLFENGAQINVERGLSKETPMDYLFKRYFFRGNTIGDLQNVYLNFKSRVFNIVDPMLCEDVTNLVIGYLTPYEHVLEGFSASVITHYLSSPELQIGQEALRLGMWGQLMQGRSISLDFVNLWEDKPEHLEQYVGERNNALTQRIREILEKKKKQEGLGKPAVASKKRSAVQAKTEVHEGIKKLKNSSTG